MQRLALAALLLALAAAPAAAQGFGKNKVQYEALDWAVLETEHLRLHYYAEEESLARPLAAFAESVCVRFDGMFRLPPKKKIPLLLYSHHHLFQQTNASQGLISEGTGGLTELIKGRVLVPHTGSWDRLRWVTKHELAHAYMLEKISRVMRENKRSQSYLPPLWFIEGLAEYCSTEWDAEAEGLMRDAVTSGWASPLTRSEAITGTVLMYKEGQSFLEYLDARFGGEKIFDLFDQWHRAEDFATAFRLTFGLRLEEVDDDWFDGIRARYYPTVATHEKPGDRGRQLTRDGRFHLGPNVLPPATPADTTLRFCYFMASEQGIDLVVQEPGRDGRPRERRLLRGGQSAQFESFHLFQNRPDASPRGTIALSSKRGGRDNLYLIDVASGRVQRRMEFPLLVALNDPALMPGDTGVVFSAMDYGGRADLYRVTWQGRRERLERLTTDSYDDVEPSVSPDGRWVVFASDRVERGGRYSLCRLSLETGAIETLSWPGAGDDRQPVYSPDGRWIAFRSTRGGTSDLWVRPAEPAFEARRVTRLLGPASDPDWLPGGRGLLYTAQSGITFHAYELRFDPDTLVAEAETPGETAPVLPAIVHTDAPKRYQRQIGLDFINNAVAVDPGFGGGTAGGGQIALSDVLGNEQIYLFIGNDSQRFGKFWDGFEGGVTYYNQSRRLNYGVGVFRLTQLYDADLDVVRREKRVGMSALVSYPFSKFTRLSGSVLLRHASDHRLRNGRIQSVDLISNYLTFTHDNARFTMLGPSSGTRLSISTGVTRDLTAGQGDFGTLLADIRNYRMFGSSVVSAARVQAQASVGRDAQRFFIGGYSSVRGYDRRTFSGTQTLLLQHEVRFPVLRGLVFSVPAPWMFPTVSGALFTDAAWTWNDAAAGGDPPRGRVSDRIGSAGVGLFIGGGYYPALRWNYAWTTDDFRTFSHKPRTQFSLTYDF